MKPLIGPVLTAAETRAAEQVAMAAGVSVDTLMERAGLALARAVWRFGGGRSTLILCGPGNNGGDGYVAARLLQSWGVTVRLAALLPPATDVSKRAAAQWSGKVEGLTGVEAAPILVDAIFGTGLSRALDADLVATLRRLRSAARMMIAADVSSGVDTDSGADLGAIPADVTVALGALKPAHLLQPAASLCGHVVSADIGLAPESTRQVIARPMLKTPSAADHKYTRGLVTILSGDMKGAARLVASAAVRSGAGYVVLAGDPDATGIPLSIVHRSPDDALADARVSAIIVGPGLGRTGTAEASVMQALQTGKPVVLDADALHLIRPGQIARHTAPVILTPHKGEFEAMFGKLPGSKIDQALAAAAASGATVIFKGADTVVASPDGRVGLSAQSSPWLSSAGTGDVLAGIAGAMLARGLDAHEAACAAVWLHNRAAHLAGPALIADDLCQRLPEALAASS
jgi:hydroxyethylthiazole kinase-like uncharacterized protein yjeF